MLETIENRLEFIRMLTFIPAGIFAIIGFYIVVKDLIMKRLIRLYIL
ncbi:hypothetical protein [Natronospora cellulosivora (SeqCode)]